MTPEIDDPAAPESGGHGVPPERVTVEAYRRADLPAAHERRIRELLSGVRDAPVDECRVGTWPRRVRLDRDCDAVDRFRKFRAWADAAGVRICPPFVVRAADRADPVLVLPALVLAVYADGSLVRVVPHEGPAGTETVSRATDDLLAGEPPWLTPVP